jgi:hypothetical protein
MREWINLFEAAPTAGTIYYHGTPLEAAAKAIMKTGLKGAEVQGRGMMAPVAGRVYMTPSLAYAIIYAIGGAYAGHEAPESMIAKSRYGYVFVIDGNDLDTVEPDEDSIGEWLHNNGKRSDGGSSSFGNRRLGSIQYEPKFKHGDPLFRLWHNVKNAMTPRQFELTMQAEYAAWAHGGKRALKVLSDNDKALLVAQGTHVHHASGIMPSQCWKLDKKRTQDLAADGSNFFEIATRVS